MPQFQQPNYNLLVYEINAVTSDPHIQFFLISLLHKNIVKKNKFNLKELYDWYEALTPKQLKDVGLAFQNTRNNSTVFEYLIKEKTDKVFGPNEIKPLLRNRYVINKAMPYHGIEYTEYNSISYLANYHERIYPNMNGSFRREFDFIMSIT